MPKYEAALDAACLLYQRARTQPEAETGPDALRRRVEARQSAIARLLKAAEARAAELSREEQSPPL